MNIIPPDAKFPDKISLKGLPEIEYPEDEVFMPEGVEPDVEEAPVVEPVTQLTEQTEVIVETPIEVKPEEVVEEITPVQAEPETPPEEEKVDEEAKIEIAKAEEETKEEN